MFLSLPVTDAPVLDTKVVCNFSSIKTTKGVKYSILKDEWLYETANDEPFAYELCFFSLRLNGCTSTKFAHYRSQSLHVNFDVVKVFVRPLSISLYFSKSKLDDFLWL